MKPIETYNPKFKVNDSVIARIELKDKIVEFHGKVIDLEINVLSDRIEQYLYVRLTDGATRRFTDNDCRFTSEDYKLPIWVLI